MSNKLSGGKLHGGLLDEKNPTLIYLVRQALEWLYDLDPADEDLDTIGNYLIAICPDAPRAEAAIIGGGSTPTITNATAPERIDFVTSVSSYIVTGASSKNIPSFIGFNLEFDRNGIPQSTVNTEASYFTWDISLGNFTCSPALSEGELVALIPV
jgi:hypothetical protein